MATDLTIKVVPWTWRDGTIHLEVRCATFPDTFSGIVTTHLDGLHFKSACGDPYWGKCSGTGLMSSQSIDCPRCKALLASLTFEAKAPEGVVRF